MGGSAERASWIEAEKQAETVLKSIVSGKWTHQHNLYEQAVPRIEQKRSSGPKIFLIEGTRLLNSYLGNRVGCFAVHIVNMQMQARAVQLGVRTDDGVAGEPEAGEVS